MRAMHLRRLPDFRLRFSPFLLSAFVALGISEGKALEPWADSKLPVKDGLELWLDATAQNAARNDRKLPLLTPDRAGDFWFDGSGKGRHVSQRVPDARPHFRQAGATAAFRFDGKDDHFSASLLNAEFADATVFVVAAPKSHAGYFRAFVSFARTGANDYTTGFNLDMGGTGTPRLQVVNTEGAGFRGQRNLLNAGTAFDFGQWHVVTLTSQAGDAGVKLFMDGKPHGSRPREGSLMRMDELVVGARVLSNDAEAPYVQSHLDGEIAEVIIFNHVLKDEDRAKVEKYLAAKHASLSAPADDPSALKPLETVANPPKIQMLVPGFTWEALPVKIPNINTIQYRPDGKLVALGYNGHLWLLSDTDGDGLEDKAEPFWEKDTMRGPIGMALTPPGYKLGQGAFVPSKGKVSLIIDKDGDDRADEEIIVASGWKEIRQNVDAVGCAIDKEGNIYFGLGTENYANGYLLDDEKKAHYATNSEHGTVQKVSPDFKKRETICTGVRFPVSMAFSPQGDLFCTDQEGATWLSNGNPFDELLHIQTGRHYGFPPRHPKHLPDVVDEPSTFDYFPQHQSTCGLCFNTSVNGGPTFGPSSWAGDAFVAGESRGKIYRTKLVKTAAGYVAQNHLIGCVAALTTDVAISPRGDLIVSTHSGKPDWGTGPQGIGTLYRIRYTGTNAPQPVVTWSASPTEIRIAFDRALDPANLKNLTKETKITQGKYVMPGDRFEAMYPGYQVVQDQKATPRYNVPVLSASVTPDNRTLVLTTPPRTAAVNYAIELPASVAGRAGLPAGLDARERVPTANVGADVRRLTSSGKDQSLLTSTPTNKGGRETIELMADLNGVQAKWFAKPGVRSIRRNDSDPYYWEGVLPEPVWYVGGKTAFLQGSNMAKTWEELITWSTKQAMEFERLFYLEGTLSVSGILDLSNILRPAIQPGASLEYAYPSEEVTVVIAGPMDFSVVFNGKKFVSDQNTNLALNKKYRVELKATVFGTTWIPFEIVQETGWPYNGRGPIHSMSIEWFTERDPTVRPFPLRRFYLPWAKPSDEPIKLATERQVPELAGGNWLRGRRLFFGEQAGCSRCHQVGGVGGKLGPDLSNLIYRDYASVMKDIREPSAAINPDHVAFNVELKGGELMTGVVIGDTPEALTLGDATGKPNVIPKSKVSSIKASAVSLMPEGLDKALGDVAMKDLLTFLLMPQPLEPAPIEGKTEPPPPRKRAEVEALLGVPPSGGSGGPAKAGTPSKMHIVLCDGPKDHGIGEHDYPLWKARWSKLIALAEDVTVDTAHIWPSKEQFAKADVIAFFNNNPGWNEERGKELDAYLARGGGAIYFHWAVEARGDAEAFARRIGLASNSGKLKYRHGPIDFQIHQHELAPGFNDTHFTKEKFIDETYWLFIGNPGDVRLLASSVEDGEARPQMWTRQIGEGRVFVAIPGHYNWTFDDPVFRVLALRGLCWAAGQPMDRLAELATVGARMAE